MAISLKKYVLAETATSVAANIVMSLFMAVVVFGLPSTVSLKGEGGLLRDLIPQTFMVTLMTIFMATFLTRKRRRAGQAPVVVALTPRIRPESALLRAVVGAVIVTIVVVPVLWLILPRTTPEVWPLAAMLAFKTVLAVSLAGLISPPVLRLVLAEA